eukprot:357548-Chlamydomonas_euryale.AAC.5
MDNGNRLPQLTVVVHASKLKRTAKQVQPAWGDESAHKAARKSSRPTTGNKEVTACAASPPTLVHVGARYGDPAALVGNVCVGPAPPFATCSMEHG